MVKTAMTVCGPVSADKLGITDAHEHLIFGYPGWEYDVDYTYDEEKVLKALVDALGEAKKYGLETVVDACAYAPIRYPKLLKAAQEKTGVNIICSTGLFNPEQGVGFYWNNLLMYGFDRELLLDRLTRSMLKELNVGIADTDIRAGIIKVSTDNKAISEYDKLVFAAAGRASKEADVPVMTHTSNAMFGVEQAEMLIEAGAKPSKIAIGHMTDTTNIAYLESIMEKGVYLNMDRFGISFTLPEKGDAGKVETLVELVKRGHADQIMLSHDAMVSVVGLGDISPALRAGLPYWKLHGNFEYFIPEMKKRGVTDEDVHKMLVENPRRFFG